MIGLARNIDTMIEPLRGLANKLGSPLLDLAIRLYMADIFLKSGWPKFKNFLDGNWQATVDQFTNVHVIPGIDPGLAAIAGTAGEFILPILLAIGLFTRLGAGGLIVITLMIEFLAVDGFIGDPLSSPIHYFWLLLLAVPFIKGPGPLSVDYFLLKFIRKNEAPAQE